MGPSTVPSRFLFHRAIANGRRPRSRRTLLPIASWKEDSHPERLAPGVGDARSLAYESTTAGDFIGVGFRAAAPPETSRLVLDLFSGGRKKKGQRFGFLRDGRKDPNIWSPDAAKAIAAHRNSILLRCLLPAKSGAHEEFFVYQSDPMALKRLGPCGHPFINYRVGNNIGIVCREEGDEFAVAHLTVTQKEGGGNCHEEGACRVTAELCYLLNKDDGSWRTKCLPIRHGEGKAEDLNWWETDAVIAFGDSICWVDYLRGMLFCDIFSSKLDLRYVPLPVTPYEGNRHPELGDRDVFAYRSVCVTQDGGAIKFVDAATSDLWFYGNPSYSSSPSTITSWIMSDDKLTWMIDGAIEIHKFFDLTSCLGLPQMQPKFPLVDMKYPQTVYFALKEETCSGTLLVPVNMFSKILGRPTAYASRSSLSSDEDESYTSSCNLLYKEPFLPCEFSKFLGLDVPCSRQ
ncbi:unnamed protein product [Urochloa decumbens]|uniref:DUF1618 domain-containing protein n=1 Tax=Urochloa decumbens TaxID=240449 RepID=A0ABC8X449_9POAL